MKFVMINCIMYSADRYNFIKTVLGHDERPYLFQKFLYSVFKNNNLFGINRIFDIKIDGAYMRLNFEYIDFIEDYNFFNSSDMYRIGIFLAQLHNYAYLNFEKFSGPCKQEKYDSLELISSYDKIETDLQRRKYIMSQIKRLDISQQKIMLHRDFRLSNILVSSNDKKLILIDFDFAAIDYVNIEVGGILADVLEYTLKSKQINIETRLACIEALFRGYDMTIGQKEG